MVTKIADRLNIRTWAIIFLLLVIVLAKGLMAFFVVGDKGQPDWDFRPLKDVPGESPYAVYKLTPNPQHVRGAEGK
jgi:hypothetical protein